MQSVLQIISKKNPLVLSFVWAILLHACCYVIWGLFFGEYTDKFLMAYVDGSFSGGIAKPVHYNYGILTGISSIMASGYSLLPQFNWYGIIGQGILLMATTGFVWLLRAFWLSLQGSKWAALGFIVFLLPFWCTHIVFYHTTELGSLACGIGILGLVASYLPQLKGVMPRLKGSRIFFTVLVMLSIFCRMEPALMCAGVMLPFGLWVVGDRAARFGLFKISLAVLPVFAGAYLLYMAAPLPGDVLFRDTRVYTHTLWDFGQDERLYKLATPADSVKLEAALAYFISDEVELSPEFYDSIGVLPLEKSLGSFDKYLVGFDLRVARAVGLLQQLNAAQPVFLMAYFIAFCAAMLLLVYNRSRHWWKLLLVNIWFMLLLFGVTVFMKMELRVLAPLVLLELIGLTAFCTYLLPLGWQNVKGNAVILVLAGLLFLVPIAIKFTELHGASQNFKIASKNMKAFKAELAQPSFKNRIVVFHSFAWQMLYADIFDINQFAGNTNFLAIDNGELYMYPQFKEAMNKCCGGYTINHLVNYLLEHKEQVVFVSDAGRMDLMERYIETVYGIPFNTRPAFPESVLSHPVSGVMLPGYADHLAFSYFVFE